MLDLLKAMVLGVVEGFTEFLPVSSTGHLLLIEHFLGFDDEQFGKTFVVLIQLGAILAILSVYFRRLWDIALRTLHDPQARRFVIGVAIAFLPAAIIGALAHGFIKNVLFNVWIVCTTLIVGGAVLLWVDRLQLKPRYTDATTFSLPMYFGIGLAQCMAMIPGVSRSGATIVSAMLFGADKRSSAEFSFFLAMPTMAGAFAYDLYKNRDVLSAADLPIITAGFLAAFVMAVIVVRSLLGYVSRNGYALFGWWRLIVGGLGLIALMIWK
jgi:undecaprenyl-diphosphatase